MDIFKLNLTFEYTEATAYRPLAEKGVLLLKEREIETIFSLGNGYIGTRNSLEEGYPESDPGSFIAGMYVQGAKDDFNFLVKSPNWTAMRIYVGDNMFDLKEDIPLWHSRYIDFDRGLAVREWRNEDRDGRITDIRIIKFISLARKHELGKLLLIKPENYSDRIRVVTGIDNNTADFGYLLNMNSDIEDFASVYMKTKHSDKDFIILQKSDFLTRQGEQVNFDYSIDNFYSGSFENFEWKAELGNQYLIKSLCSAHTRSDSEVLAREAKKVFVSYEKDFFNESIENHCNKWMQRLSESKITVKGNDYDQKLIDLATYHLITAGEFSGNTCSIPARDLSGESYKGHVFWDTEMYLLPFFTLTKPEIARNLLMYRYNTLDGARENAKKEDFAGASYAWESTDSGLEAAPEIAILPDGEVIKILSGSYENHISSDIAYSVWKYWQATHDIDFLVNYGAEILFETASFCKSLMHKGEDDLYHINSVIGPDEYHECVDNNAYTNYLAEYNFEIALKTYDLMKSESPEQLKQLKKKIGLKNEGVEEWRSFLGNIYLGYDEKTNLFEQFEGFYELKYIDLDLYKTRTVPMDIILGREKTRESQVIKQPDVLMFMTLFGERFPQEDLITNYEFYEKRCGHGSSLSPSIHSIAASRTGKANDAYKYFLKNATIDVGDSFGNAAGGIHIASQGGVWMSVVLGFAGLHSTSKGLAFTPNLPAEWESIEFPIVWRGQELKITLSQDKLDIFVTGNINLSIGFDNWRETSPNTTYTAVKQDNKWKWEEQE